MANDANNLAKVSGYLEKKGKIRMVSSWKKYWFVLEGRLLLYYRSRTEYELISPCKGSITLGPPCIIKPTLSSTCTFQIEARANTVTLRAENRADYELWTKAILSALDQTATSPSKMSHFRYSADDLAKAPTGNKKKQKVFSRQNTMPERTSQTPPPKQTPKQLIERLQSLGAHSYGGSLQTINKLASSATKLSPNLPKNQNLQRLLKNSGSVHDITFTSGDDTKGTCDDNAPNKYDDIVEVPSHGQKGGNTFNNHQTIMEGTILVEKETTDTDAIQRLESCSIDKENYAIPNTAAVKNTAAPDSDRPETIGKRSNKNEDLIENDQYVKYEQSEDVPNNDCLIENDTYEKLGRDDKTSELNDREDSFLRERDTYSNAEDLRKDDGFVTENYFSRASTDTSNYCEIDDIVGRNVNGGESKAQNHTREITSTDNVSNEHSSTTRENLTTSTQTKENAKRFNANQIDNIYQEISTSKDDVGSTNNDMYQEVKSTKQTASNKYGSESDLYSVPHTDFNKNTLTESPYAITKLYDSIYSSNDQIYAKPEKFYEEAPVVEDQPVLPPRPKDKDETSSQSSNDVKPKKVNRLRKLARMMSDRKKDGPKRGSFVVRVFNRMRKNGGNKDLGKDENKELDDEETSSSSVDAPVFDEKIDENVKMLNELQVVLHNKKTVIEEKIRSESESDQQETPLIITTHAEEHLIAQPKYEKKECVEKKAQSKSPNLPPKQKLPQIILEYRIPPDNETIYIPRLKLKQTPRRNKQRIKETQPPPLEETPEEKLKTIDEILDDLDKEKTELESKTKQKVKQLIEKFNENKICEDSVEMRKKNDNLHCSSRDSVDLSLLLHELSKVTSAPILAPGVTSSLITTPLTNDEWLRLIPIRKRRLSEPDYDIPRPHSSLQYIKTEVDRENAIEPTRFFGPVLLDREQYGDTNEPSNVSITPDSLEIDQTLEKSAPFCQSSFEEDRSIFSYTSHNYSKEMKTLDRKISKNHRLIYARPKSLITLSQKNEHDCEHVKNRPADEENNNYDDFADSLELFENKEDSTVF